MTAGELALLINGKLIASNAENEISGGTVCDLLSHAMTRLTMGSAWVTVQTHITVVAVALLAHAACIIWPDDIPPDMQSAAKAEQEGIAIISSPLSAYEIVSIMSAHGIAADKAQ